MRAEVCSVGTELLLGDLVDTNAAHIGAALASIGVDCFHRVTVGDNEERIAEAIGTALSRADACIVTGGLGPTQDDVTREAIARVTGRALRRQERIAQNLRERFARMGRAMPESNLRQADVPEGATVIDAAHGTAPGLVVEHGDGVIYAMPGVPSEMEEMLARAVLPDLARRAGGAARILTRVIRVAGVTESGVADAMAPLWERLGARVKMSFLAGGGDVRVRVTAKAATDEEARALVDDAAREVRAVLGVAVVGTDDETLERVVGDLLRARGWTIGCAESLTAGLLGARIADVAGASEWFRGSIVSYATEAKAHALGVAEDVLTQHGAVSEATARAMAAAARERLETTIGVGVTGVAGPAEQEGKPVGSVFAAVSGPDGETARALRMPGDRRSVRARAAAAALNLTRLYLLREAR